jgi:hypothetical protein
VVIAIGILALLDTSAKIIRRFGKLPDRVFSAGLVCEGMFCRFTHIKTLNRKFLKF